MDYSLGSGINPDIVYDPSHDDYILVWELGITSTTSHIMGSRIAGSCCTGPACGGTPFIISDDRPGYRSIARHHLQHECQSSGFPYRVA